MVATVTLPISDETYHRLELNAQATGRSIEEILAYVLKVGSPPMGNDIPIDLQSDLIHLDGLRNPELNQIATAQKFDTDWDRYDILLDLNSQGKLSDSERSELLQLRQDCDRFTLRKAQAALLLKWRGHPEILTGE